MRHTVQATFDVEGEDALVSLITHLQNVDDEPGVSPPLIEGIKLVALSTHSVAGRIAVPKSFAIGESP